MKKWIFITGASRGIGRAIALQQAKEGYHLACAYHKEYSMAKSLQQEVKALGQNCLLFSGNLGDSQTAQNIMREVLDGVEAVGQLEALVLNAGISHMGLCQDTSPAQWQEVMAVNLNSMHSLLQIALPPMIARHRGSIVTLGSMWGQVGASYEVAYATAKAGVLGLTKSLALELAPVGIRVNCVSPGFIATDMNSMLNQEEIQCFIEKIPLGRMGTVEEVAEVVSFLLSQKSSYLTGQILGVNGGLIS